MIITNDFDLPKPLVEAIKSGIRAPEENVIHVTELINPPQIAYLKRLYWRYIVVDVSELIWAFFGQVAHKVLEKQKKSLDQLKEHQLFMDLGDGLTLTGQADLWENGVLTDYKFTSVWSFILSDKPEWEQQINVYAELFRQSGLEVREAQIIAFLRDWKERDFQIKEDYPPRQVIRVPIPLWEPEEVRQFIRARADSLKLSLLRGIIRECTPDERWFKGDVWAVKKKGNKRAVTGGLKDTEEGARALVELLKEVQGGEFEIEFRAGENTRCERYCPVRDFCKQFDMIKTMERMKNDQH